jgi:signal transduction protein with GAF and PtsI domain
MARLCGVSEPLAEAPGEYLDIDFLHEIGKNASSVPLSKTLGRISVFVSSAVRCDSCFVYLLDGRDLVLRASKNPHKDALDRLKIQVGQGITGWVAQQRQTVAIPQKAYQDARFKSFNELPEDRYEAFLSVPLLCRDKVTGVINVQHRKPYFHSRRDIQLISTIGFLVAAEIEITRLEAENWKLNRDLQARSDSGTSASK